MCASYTTSGWEIGTERSVVNNLHRLAVWGTLLSSHFGPYANFIIFAGADYKCLVVERLESCYLFSEMLNPETCSVPLFVTGKEYCNMEFSGGNATSLVYGVSGEQGGTELVKQRIQRGERKSIINEDNE